MPSKPLPVKRGQRSVRRRSAVPNLKIIFPLLMCRAARRAFPIVRSQPLPRSGAAGEVSDHRKRAGRSAGPEAGRSVPTPPSLPLDSTHPATGKGLLAPFRPQRGSRTGKNLAASLRRVAALCVCFVPWEALASCRPLPQQLLPASAAGGGRRRCTFFSLLRFEGPSAAAAAAARRGAGCQQMPFTVTALPVKK